MAKKNRTVSIDDKVCDSTIKFEDAIRELHNTANSGHDDGVGSKELAVDFIEYYAKLIANVTKHYTSVKKDLEKHYDL